MNHLEQHLFLRESGIQKLEEKSKGFRDGSLGRCTKGFLVDSGRGVSLPLSNCCLECVETLRWYQTNIKVVRQREGGAC
jgi:hypothetical protein